MLENKVENKEKQHIYQGRTLQQVVSDLSNTSSDMEYASIEGLLVATLGFLRDYEEIIIRKGVDEYIA